MVRQVANFFLLTGIYQGQPFAYLDHDVSHYGEEVLDVLYSELDFIAGKLEKDLIGSSSSETLADLNNIYLILGGGQRQPYDILRHAFSLMINPDVNAQNQAKAYFANTNVNILYDKLVKNVIILKSVSYVMTDPEETEAKKADLNEILDPPSLALYYDCVIDRGYLAIEWGKKGKVIHLAYMLFGLRATEKPKLTWNMAYDQIEQIKKAIGDKCSDQALEKALREKALLEKDLLEKDLEYIPDDPVFDTVYTDSDLPLSSSTTTHDDDPTVDD